MAEQRVDASSKEEDVYIVITQCLQNGFFLADENRLCLPAETVKQMLIGEQDAEMLMGLKNRRRFGSRIKTGPLYRFLDSAITPYRDGTVKNHTLHVIHIKDWHLPSAEYDLERNLYGAHCEAFSWDSEPIEGFNEFLQPWIKDKESTDKAKGKEGYRDGNATFYEVLSDSVFDFRPDATIDLDPSFGNDSRKTHLQYLLDDLIGYQHKGKRIYVVMLGVYTDIKIKMLLSGLRTRYAVDNLIVSDILTAAPSLERHLEGLDFASKVLNVEIIHSLNELASVLNPERDESAIPIALTKNTLNFRDYRTYFLDKQNILGFQDQRLLEYLSLTNKRSLQVYTTIYRANLFLIGVGMSFLILTVILIIARLVNPTIPVDILWVTGGLGTVQVLASFFTAPFDRMRQNLTALVRLRNYLETYSNLSALLRHHLTLADRLQPNLHDDATYLRASRELELLERQINLVENASTKMTLNFPDLMVNPNLLTQIQAANAQAAQANAAQTNTTNTPTGNDEGGAG